MGSWSTHTLLTDNFINHIVINKTKLIFLCDNLFFSSLKLGSAGTKSFGSSPKDCVRVHFEMYTYPPTLINGYPERLCEGIGQLYEETRALCVST